MAEARPPPSVTSLAPFGARILSAVVFRACTVPFRLLRWNGASRIYNDIFFAAIRAMLGSLTIAQSRYIAKSTSGTYLDLCKEVKEEPKNLVLPNVTAHWIGDEDADVVILYLHGGGYTQACSIGHMQYFHRLVKDINTSGGGRQSVSVLLPAYSLAPEAPFPTQLNQAVDVLAHLLGTMKRSPSSILITGDSAGGGLALSLLSSILHPESSIRPEALVLSEPLRGTFLYSPWVSFSTKHESYSRNAQKDTLVPSALRKWASMYLGTAHGEDPVNEDPNGNHYNEPLSAGPHWWKGMHKVVREMFIWAGEDEVFVDGLNEFGGDFWEGWKAGGGEQQRVKLYVGPQEAHIGPIMDVMLHYKNKGKSQLDLEDWLNQLLRTS